MKLAAVARVKNELDIIEPFVHHHAQHFDKVIVLDDGSSDGTYELLQRLRPHFRDLVVLREPVIGYQQNRYMELLVRMAVDKFAADWVALLDADEFIEPNDGMRLAQVLAGRKPAVYELRWSNFVWTPDLERSEEENPVIRQRFRNPPRSDSTKLLIHAQFAEGRFEITLGNHALLKDNAPVASKRLELVGLCHYPVRSINQYVSKIAVGYLQYAATPGWERETGFHYVKPFKEVATSGMDGVMQRMTQDSRFYGVRESERLGEYPEAVEAPLNYLGGRLTCTPQRMSHLPNLLRHAEFMATRLAAGGGKSPDLDRVSSENAFLRRRVSALELEIVSAQETTALQARGLQSRTFRFLTRVHSMVRHASSFGQLFWRTRFTRESKGQAGRDPFA